MYYSLRHSHIHLRTAHFYHFARWLRLLCHCFHPTQPHIHFSLLHLHAVRTHVHISVLTLSHTSQKYSQWSVRRIWNSGFNNIANSNGRSHKSRHQSIHHLHHARSIRYRVIHSWTRNVPGSLSRRNRRNTILKK